MTISFFHILFLLALSPLDGALSECRTLFFDAEDDERIERFYNDTSEMVSDDPIVNGYQAVATATYGSTILNPLSKWNYFDDGRDALEFLIEAHPSIVELRFLRLSVQANAPIFVGYNDNIEEDLLLVKTRVETKATLDKEFWSKAISVLLASHHFSVKQVKILSNMQSGLSNE